MVPYITESIKLSLGYKDLKDKHLAPGYISFLIHA